MVVAGDALYRLSQADCFYIVAKVTVDTDEAVYPFRPSEYRDVSHGKGVRVQQEFPRREKEEWTFEVGEFTTWLKTDELRHALAHNRVMRCHECVISMINLEHKSRWQKLREQMFRLFGRTCMRCGRTTGEMHVDHVRPWSKYPELRHDAENLQVLCRECHAWKEADGSELNFRPDILRKR